MARIEGVVYEWDVETVVEYGDDEEDIVDHDHRTNAAECLARLREPARVTYNGEEVTEITRMVLVCDIYSERAWAYVKDGKLPTHFTDAFGAEVRKVPKRFHDELHKALAEATR